MRPIAVLVSDLHLSLLQPSCRADKDWMKVQEHYLDQVRAYNLPVVCAGDLFDKWNPPPELIRWALEHLPDRMICVPGQHDLPNHRMDLMHRSAYGVLVEANKIIDIHGRFLQKAGLVARGFGWNEEIEPLKERVGPSPHIAVIHRYCWTEGKSYPGAPKEDNVTAFVKQLKGYDVAVFGDNHKGFLSQAGDCTVINCGGFIRRKSDEVDYQPKVGLLYEDGSVKRKSLDTSIDKFRTAEKERPETPFNMREFTEGLESLGEGGVDFKEAVKQHLKKEDLDEETAQIILQALEPHA